MHILKIKIALNILAATLTEVTYLRCYILISMVLHLHIKFGGTRIKKVSEQRFRSGWAIIFSRGSRLTLSTNLDLTNAFQIKDTYCMVNKLIRGPNKRPG